MLRHYLTATALCVFAMAPPETLAAQAIHGHVIDSELGTPVAGATVTIGHRPPVTTDSAGQFTDRNVPPGTQQVEIKQIGFEPGVFDVRIPDTGTVQGVFPMDFNGYLLPAVVVEAHAEALAPRYADFERRRQSRTGAYLRWDELKKMGATSIGDALRTIRGVRMDCDQQAFECYVHMARSPQCQPTWYVDGVEVHSFNENTPIRDVYGIEVYRGPGETPAEFTGSNAACGVIVVWTKSRPYVR